MHTIFDVVHCTQYMLYSVVENFGIDNFYRNYNRTSRIRPSPVRAVVETRHTKIRGAIFFKSLKQYTKLDGKCGTN